MKKLSFQILKSYPLRNSFIIPLSFPFSSIFNERKREKSRRVMETVFNKKKLDRDLFNNISRYCAHIHTDRCKNIGLLAANFKSRVRFKLFPYEFV